MTTETYQLSNNSLGLELDLYQIIDRPVAPRSISLEDSPIRLISSESKDNPQPTLLIISPDLTKQWQIRDKSQIGVYEKESLATIDFTALDTEQRSVLPILANSTKQNSNKSTKLNLNQAEWRVPQDLFTERILLVENPARKEHTPFPGAKEIIGQKSLNNWSVPILPIKSELLRYLDIDYLTENIEIFQVDDRVIVVELKLTLAGSDGKGKDFLLKREYRDEEIERRSNTNLPVLEIWPNFKAENWKFYYTYYDSVGMREEDTFFAKPYLETGSLSAQKKQPLPRQIWHSESLPTAMICETYSRNLKKNVEVGCLLLADRDFPLISPQQGRSWNIGIDFGTSSTNVYACKNNENEPSEVSFQKRLSPITQASENNRGEMVKYFFPPFEPSTPFLTLFRPEENAINLNASEDSKPLLRGNIRYVKPGLHWNPDSGEIDVKSRFKWQFDRNHVEGFLSQIAVQCLAEAVAQGATEVNWHFSFPTVVEDNAKNIQTDAWQKIIDLTEQLNIKTKEIAKKTESQASAIFFAEKHRVPPTGVICIDIGGETSDLSFIGDGFPRECSVRFAGEHIFTDLLKKNPSVLGNLGFPDIDRLKQASLTNNFYSQIDSLVRTNREQLWKKLQQAPDLQQTDPDGKVYGLLHLIALGLSGLMFYTGLQFKDLRDKELLQGDYLPTICFGGNGAWTLQWLGRGNFNSASPQYNLFRQVFQTASGLEEDTGFDIVLSSNPKAEVAYGLIKPSDIELKNQEQTRVELSGEDFRDSRGGLLGWNTALNKEILSSGLHAPEQLIQLRQFVELFNQYAKNSDSYVRSIDFSRYERNIVKDLQVRLDTFKNLTPQRINAVEPLFLIALRRLVMEECDRWANDWK